MYCLTLFQPVIEGVYELMTPRRPGSELTTAANFEKNVCKDDAFKNPLGRQPNIQQNLTFIVFLLFPLQQKV